MPRVTAPLTPELETALHAQASAAGRTPEVHAAHLIAQGLIIRPETGAANAPSSVTRIDEPKEQP